MARPKSRSREPSTAAPRSPQDSRREVERLRQEIEHHNYRYYVLDDPVVTDEEYDALFRRLQALEDANPLLRSPSTSSRRSGAAIPCSRSRT